MNIHRVSNGVSKANFSKAAIESMKMLGLIQFRGTTTVEQNVTVYLYTGTGDNRKVIL